MANAAKVQTALKLSQEDQNTIASLKREIEKAWKMVDAAHEKEGRAKETIQQLKHEIQNLSRLVEQVRVRVGLGSGLGLGLGSGLGLGLECSPRRTAPAPAPRSCCQTGRP